MLAVLGAFGNAWDLYWHILVGRDSFWIPPHTMMYTAVALSGLLALAVVLHDTLRARPSDEITSFFGFRAPLGYIVLGFGTLQMVLSAPFDDWWHRTFGLDVTVWSPPHLVGFSGATVMLSGLIIAAAAEWQCASLRAPVVSRRSEWLFFGLLALLFALVVRWVTFLNSTTLGLSWALEPDRYSIAGPWAPWWGLWASLFMAWTFVASARLLPGTRDWLLPLVIVGGALALRALEFAFSAVGFSLVLPWGTQTLREPFRMFFDYDLGLWITTAVLVPPTIVVALLCRRARRWGALRFGLTAGAVFGLVLGAQFLILRPVFDLVPLATEVQAQVLVISAVAGLVGGIIGGYQGDWLARFRR